MPVLVDGVDNSAYDAYEIQTSAFFVIDAHGRQAFRSGRPPDGMRAEEVEAALAKLTSVQ